MQATNHSVQALSELKRNIEKLASNRTIEGKIQARNLDLVLQAMGNAVGALRQKIQDRHTNLRGAIENLKQLTDSCAVDWEGIYFGDESKYRYYK